MSSLQTEEIRDGAALAALGPEWCDLWQRSPAATPFQAPAWLLSWWRHFAPGSLFTVLVRQAGRLVGMAPFYIEEGPFGRRILPLGMSLSDYLDVLLDPDFKIEAGRAIVAHVMGRGDLWDRWDLEELPPDASALGLLAPAACDAGWSPHSACPVLTLLPAGIEASVPARRLRKLRMARNRMARRGAFEIVQARPEEVRAFMEELFRLHAARWESRGEGGVLAEERVRAFHREAAEGLTRAGLVRLYGLRLDGRMRGIYYGFHHAGRAFAYLGGFDPEFAFESPGTLLIHHAILEAYREGAREFHFLRGQEAYKYEWGAVDRWNQRCVIRQPAHAESHA